MTTTQTQDYDQSANRDAEVSAGDFYVTVRDLARNRTGFLLGPYEDYRDALANERRGRSLAAPADHFNEYVYGVSRVPQNGSPRPRTVFTLEGRINR